MSNIHGLVTKVAIKADAQGNPPATIEVLRIGDWHTPWHGDFEITMADLHEFAANFAKGVGLVEGDARAPINYAHESWNEAAGWMTSLAIDESRNALVAHCEWTAKGAEALRDGLWAYISPEFNPRGCPWFDAEGTDDPDGVPEFVNNVLTGAALTNIPLFKKLKPIMASRVPSKSKAKKADVTSGDGKKSNQGEPMKLEDILAKQVSERSDEETAFLSDHAADLTDEQKAQVETEANDAEAQAKADKEAADQAAAEQAAKDKAAADAKAAEDAKVEASRKGQVSISASKLAALEASAKRADALAAEIDRNKATATVQASIKAGQVKSGEEATWTDFLVGLKADQRSVAEELLASLPKNEGLGKELGDSGKEVETTAEAELDVKASALQKESDGKLTYSAATKQVLASDKELRERIDAERKSN